jgi:chromosome segregation ATPase
MFFEQVAQNATTWSRTLQELANLRVEFEQSKENLFETHNCLQTYSLKLEIVHKTLKNRDKELVIIKGQLNKVQHENQNLSNKLKEAKQLVRQTKNLQQKYVKLNQLN